MKEDSKDNNINNTRDLMSKPGASNLPGFKTSIRKSAGTAVARASAASAARTAANAMPEASPNLRGTKRRSKEEPPNPPAVKKMSVLQDLAAAFCGITNRLDKIDKELRGNATKDNVMKVQAAITGLRTQVSSNEENIEWLIKCRERDEARQRENLAKSVQGEIQKRIGAFRVYPVT